MNQWLAGCATDGSIVLDAFLGLSWPFLSEEVTKDEVIDFEGRKVHLRSDQDINKRWNLVARACRSIMRGSIALSRVAEVMDMNPLRHREARKGIPAKQCSPVSSTSNRVSCPGLSSR